MVINSFQAFSMDGALHSISHFFGTRIFDYGPYRTSTVFFFPIEIFISFVCYEIGIVKSFNTTTRIFALEI